MVEGVFQTFNKKTNAWVKYRLKKDRMGRLRSQILNVKQKNPATPFKGVKKRK